MENRKEYYKAKTLEAIDRLEQKKADLVKQVVKPFEPLDEELKNLEEQKIKLEKKLTDILRESIEELKNNQEKIYDEADRLIKESDAMVSGTWEAITEQHKK